MTLKIGSLLLAQLIQYLQQAWLGFIGQPEIGPLQLTIAT